MSNINFLFFTLPKIITFSVTNMKLRKQQTMEMSSLCSAVSVTVLILTYDNKYRELKDASALNRCSLAIVSALRCYRQVFEMLSF